MVYTLDEIRERVAPVARKYQIPRVYVFGSYARGEATDESDIDLLYVHTDKIPRGWYIMGFYDEMERALGKRVDLVPTQVLDDESERKSKQRMRREVMRERRLIYANA
jgi:predicted nucleotidyltransferase